VDLNFANVPQFTLGTEGDRPVFAPITAIDAHSGLIAFAATRQDSSFGRIATLHSDGKTEARQISFALSPASYRHDGFTYGLGYAFASVRQYARGTMMLDPTGLQWTRGSDPRHTFRLVAGYQFRHVRLSAEAGVISGIAYTPLVNQDINGDGLANDAAFLPEGSGDSLGAAFQSFLARAPDRARHCLERQRGQVAVPNSCRGPWQAMLNMQMNVELPRRWGYLSVNVLNALGAVDYLVHGGDRRGWGDSRPVDPTLLYVNGFDPATRRYRYAINDFFGTSGVSRTLAARRSS
jgi:hypothetical protein